jgi:hypothetical protein
MSPRRRTQTFYGTFASGAEIPIQHSSDSRAPLGAKGDFKQFGVVGLDRFEADLFLKTISLWREVVAECPDAINTSFNFQWDSRPVKPPQFDSAVSLHDIRYWQCVDTFPAKSPLNGVFHFSRELIW